ncbi:hypothetical protein R3P38DRAFT_3235038 [Favolaschia claudopus]|uniref:Uncharacterized protein n=1 Tax=Favolaschia claudopus TaxID=2862362 RepID=A0AAV9ZFT2_9AGAR
MHHAQTHIERLTYKMFWIRRLWHPTLVVKSSILSKSRIPSALPSKLKLTIASCLRDFDTPFSDKLIHNIIYAFNLSVMSAFRARLTPGINTTQKISLRTMIFIFPQLLRLGLLFEFFPSLVAAATIYSLNHLLNS